MNDGQSDNSNGIRSQEHHGTVWLDVENPDATTFAKLESDYNLHPVHLNESVQKVQFTQVEQEDQYIYMLLHAPSYDAQSDRAHINQIGIFLGKDYLITIHRDPSPLVDERFAHYLHAGEHSQEHFKKGSGYLLYSLIKALLDNLASDSQSVLTELDEIEGLVFDNRRSDAYRIGKVRRRIIRLKRIVAPLKVVLDDLSQHNNSFTGENLSKYYSNNTKTAGRLLEIIKEAKETIEIYKDADFTTSTEQTNQLLAVLTLIFTLTIPISVVGALYGMNVPLPGGIQTGSWTFFGQYTTFGILIIGSFGLAFAMYLYLKQKRWF